MLANTFHWRQNIHRHLATRVLDAAASFPAVAITGPRQSGKTTLCRTLFPDHAYVNLEKPDTRNFAIEDPNGFLDRWHGPVIFDEVQRVPQLFSYIMPLIDEERIPGRFILTGSQNFLLLESISQSLAGRCAVTHLMPFSLREILQCPPRDVTCCCFSAEACQISAPPLLEHLHRGGFPAIHDQGHAPQDWLAQYVQTYLERDVRTLINIGDLDTFQRFLRLCAGRSGQLLNLSSLASDCGVSVMTAKRWLSVLQTSFIIFLLRPHHRNFSKRLIKSPKLYFADTGLLCYLLSIRTPEDLGVHGLRGAVFESYVVAEMTKAYIHQGLEPPLAFWRDSTGHEIDLLIEHGQDLYPIEIKAGQTVASDMLSALHWWSRLSGSEPGALVYAGSEGYTREGVCVTPWHAL